MRYTLVMEMYNHDWVHIKSWWPMFTTKENCEWWGDFLARNYELFHDAIVFVNRCEVFIQ